MSNASKVCSADECLRPVQAKGLCQRHYRAQKIEAEDEPADEALTPTPCGEPRCPQCHLIQPCRHATLTDLLAVNRTDDTPYACILPK